MKTGQFTRRQFLTKAAAAAAGLAVLGAQCGPTPTPERIKETVIVEKPVEKVVKETVVVEKPVTKEVTKIIEVPTIKEKVVVATPTPLPPLKRGGRLVYVHSLPCRVVTPGNAYEYPVGYDALFAIFNRLIEWDENWTPQLKLAESYEVSKDGLTWTFKLRKGIKFHDGTPFNAEAVKINLEFQGQPNPPTPRQGFWGVEMAESKVLDEYTLAIKLKRQTNQIIYTLGHGYGSMMSPASIQKYPPAELGLHPVGTGPYKLKEFVPGQYLLLEKFKDYWEFEPYLDEILFKAAPEIGSRAAMLETGEAQVIADVPPHEAKRLAANPDIRIISRPSARMFYAGMNVDKEPFNDVRVRQAFNYAVDKQIIVDQIFLGRATVADSPLSPNMHGYNKLGPYPYDPEKAKKLLAEAGWIPGSDGILQKGGKKMELIWFASEGEYPNDIIVQENLQEQYKKIGVKIVLQKIEAAARWGTDYLRVAPDKAKFNMFFWAFNPSSGEPASMLTLKPNPGPDKPVDTWNMMHYNNTQLWDKIEGTRYTVDEAQREKLLQEVQKVAWEEAPWVYLYVPDVTIATRKDIAGMKLLPISMVYFKEAGFTAK